MNLVLGGSLKLPISVLNTTGETAHLEAWIDWNGDGKFDGPGEMVLNLNDGVESFPGFINLTIPAGATINQSLGFRLRLSLEDDMTPYGTVESGEVEDYLIDLLCADIDCQAVEVIVRKKTN